MNDLEKTFNILLSKLSDSTRTCFSPIVEIEISRLGLQNGDQAREILSRLIRTIASFPDDRGEKVVFRSWYFLAAHPNWVSVKFDEDIFTDIMVWNAYSLENLKTHVKLHIPKEVLR